MFPVSIRIFMSYNRDLRHSQVPYELYVDGADIRIFRAPGGRADSFSMMRNTQIGILWLGSNDMDPDTSVSELSDSKLSDSE